MPTKKKQVQLIRQSIGTLNRVVEMLENDEYCFDVIQQLQSVNGTNKKVVQSLLDNHLRTCVVQKFQSGPEAADQAIAELLKVFNSKS